MPPVLLEDILVSKKALCIRRDDIALDGNGLSGIGDGFWLLPTQLVERAQCEADESLLQLIPYTVIVNSDGHVLTYRRGAAGDEGRLMSKLSIGVGGHIDRAPADDETLLELVKAEGQREIYEEAGADIDDLPSPVALIFTPHDAVGRVHLGLLTVCLVDEGAGDRIGVAEPGVVDELRFVPPQELLSMSDQLEDWSIKAVNFLFGDAAFSPANASVSIGKLIRAVGRTLSTLGLESATGVSSAALQEIHMSLTAIGINVDRGNATAGVFDRAEALGALLDLVAAIREVADTSYIPLGLAIAQSEPQ